MKRTTVDLWVGVFVVAGLISLLTLALKVGNANTIPAAHAYSVYAEFDNIGGLKTRAPVKSAGVVVGRVDVIALDKQNYLAKVTIRLADQYKFPMDTTASILTSGLLGEQYIGLDAGGDTTELKQGDRIRLTQSAVVLEKLIGQFLYGKAAEGGTKK
ncbi:MAG: outer membrane lipid asymmetry maintenance protein MlaD [Betaproteobacteria bacterium]